MSDHKETKILEGEEEVILEIENDESEQGFDSVQPPDNKKMKIMEEEEEEEDMSLEIEEVEPEDSLDSDLLQKKSLVLQNGVNKAAFKTGNLFGPYDIRGSPVLINGKPIEFEEGLKLDRNGRHGSFVYQTNDPNTVATSDRLYINFVSDQTNIRATTDTYYLCSENDNYVHLSKDGNVVLRARNPTNTAFVRIRQCDLVVDQDITTNNIICLGGIGSQSDHIVSFPTGPKGNVDDVLAIDGVVGNIVYTKWKEISEEAEFGPLEYVGDADLSGGTLEAALYCRKSNVHKSRNIYHLVLFGAFSSTPLNFNNFELHFEGVDFTEHPNKVFQSFDNDKRAYIEDIPRFGSYTYHFSPSILEAIDKIQMGSMTAPSAIYILFSGSTTSQEFTGNLYTIITF